VSRNARLRYYVDADLLGLAHLLVSLRADTTYPGDAGGTGIDGRARPACPVSAPSARDVDWLPVVAARGWVILTKDLRISRLPEERRAVRENAARMVVISSGDREKLRKWGQLEILFTQWRRIEGLAEIPGPWIYRATRGSFTRLDLQSGRPSAR
jgi:hypothetical protein